MVESDPKSNESVEALRRELEDLDVARQYAEILGFISLLNGCLVSSGFRLDDAWVAPIRLTPLGVAITKELQEKYRRVKPNDARMSVFLSVGCAAGLLIDPATDVVALRRKLSGEIQSGRVLFPWIFGRELHDAAAALYGERTKLTHHQSIALTKALPAGVFQEAHSLVGPFGCLESRQYRSLPSSRVAPGYLCSDETCQTIHSIYLETGNAAINRTNEHTRNLLHSKYSERPDDHAPALRDALLAASETFSKHTSADLASVLADALSEDELRVLADVLMRESFRQDGIRAELSRATNRAIGNPLDFAKELDRAALLQLILWFSDEDIHGAIDRSVRTGALEVEPTDVRVHRISRWGGRSQVEIGPLGSRITGSLRSGHVARRLYQLLHRLYFESEDQSPEDLAYLLDMSSEAADSPDLLTEAVMGQPPRELLKAVALGQRQTANRTAEFFGVVDGDSMDRDTLLEHLLWKLGVPGAPQFRELDRVAEYSDRLDWATRRNEGDDVLRGHISNLFAAVEDALQRALVFTTWALTLDHLTSAVGFEYNPAQSGAVLTFLQEHAATTNPDLQLSEDGKNTLQPLAAAFSRIAKAVRLLDPELNTRPKYQYPPACRLGDRPFAFRHTLPVLDLSPEARDQIVVELSEVGRAVQDDVVLKVRNSTIHGNAEFPSMREIEYAIERLARWRELLLSSGIFPQVFELTETRSDSFGRQVLAYQSRGAQTEVLRPQWPLAPRLPGGVSRLVVLSSAVLPGLGPLRFTIKPRAGEDPYWADWPRRWQTRSEYGHRSEEPDSFDAAPPTQSA